MSKACAVFEEEGLNSVFYVGQSKVTDSITTDTVPAVTDNIHAGEVCVEHGDALQANEVPAAWPGRDVSSHAADVLAATSLVLRVLGQRYLQDILRPEGRR